MAFEISKKGNYIFIEDSTTGLCVDYPLKDFRIAKKFVGDSEYAFYYDNAAIKVPDMCKVPFTDITGPGLFTDEASFCDWYAECTGGAGSITGGGTDVSALNLESTQLLVLDEVVDIDENTKPIVHEDITKVVQPGDGTVNIGSGAYGYTASLELQAGVDPNTIDWSADFGDINGIKVTIGHTTSIDGDLKSLLRFGIDITANGKTQWVFTEKR